MCHRRRWKVKLIKCSWLAELGPMFFAVKQKGYSQSEKRKEDQEYAITMEMNLQKNLERRATELRASTEKVAPLSRIATPGSRSFRLGTTGGIRTPGAMARSTPRKEEPKTPRSRLGL